MSGLALRLLWWGSGITSAALLMGAGASREFLIGMGTAITLIAYAAGTAAERGGHDGQ